jgi:hypothetical protein
VTANRRTIPATCNTHGTARGFCNLVMTKEAGNIQFNPHATGSCVIEIDEAAATQIRDQLTEWLG